LQTNWETRAKRGAGLYKSDKSLQIHKSQDNHFLLETYEKYLGEIGGHTAHELLHTEYHSKRRISGINLPVLDDAGPKAKLNVSVCVGTSCFIRGSQALLKQIVEHVEEQNLVHVVQVEATFCTENCDRGPTVCIGDQVLLKAKLADVVKVIDAGLQSVAN
jgi:NADH-quinone oxidoreductase subunit G